MGVELGRTLQEEHGLKVIVKGAEEDEERSNRRMTKIT
jgi:hypothetical protein